MNNELEKIGRILENPKYQRFLILQLISLCLIAFLIIIYMSINNDVLLHDYFVRTGLLETHPKKVDGLINITNYTILNS